MPCDSKLLESMIIAMTLPLSMHYHTLWVIKLNCYCITFRCFAQFRCTADRHQTDTVHAVAF